MWKQNEVGESSIEEGGEGEYVGFHLVRDRVSSSSGVVQVALSCYPASKSGLLRGLLRRSSIQFLPPLFTSTALGMSRFPCVALNLPVFLMNLNTGFIAFGCDSMVAKDLDPCRSVKKRSRR